MPTTRTPRELLLTALQRRHLTGYRASEDQAWVVFPPQEDGGTTLQVVHLPRLRRYRVVCSETAPGSTAEPTMLGEFKNSADAVACIEQALAQELTELGAKSGLNGTHRMLGTISPNGKSQS